MENFYIETSTSTDGVNYPSVSIYFFGCDKLNKCKGCHNEKLWSFTEQKNDNSLMIQKIEKELLRIYEYTDKVSVCFLGGEPLSEKHRDSVKVISKYFKQKYKKVITIVYTWRLIEDIIQQNLLNYLCSVDYLKCGEFDSNLMSNGFLATSNQYFYDLKHCKKINKKGVL